MFLLKTFGWMVRGLFDEKALVEQLLAATEAVFRSFMHKKPKQNQHVWLAETWLNRQKALGREPDEQTMKKAYDATYLFACLPRKNAGRALGLYFARQEFPGMFEKYPEYAEEYSESLTPVLRALENGTVSRVYRQVNLRLAA